MAIQIQVLSVSVTTVPTQKGSYQSLEVAYKDLSNNGKVASKKLMSFTNKTVFETLATSKPTDVYEVEMVKNDKGYWDWTKATKGAAGTSAPTVTGGESTQARSVGNTNATSVTKGGWETPEERAKKQIYIVRQSSISSAINALSVGSKVHPTVKDVIEYARELEAYVFEVERNQASIVKADVGRIEDIDEDIPL